MHSIKEPTEFILQQTGFWENICTTTLVATFPKYIGQQMYQGSVPSIRRPMLNKFQVAIPSLDVQSRIVNVLDNFDAICTDLSSGLPAEIEARQKQYEYYRDKLLSFEEKI